ncbi:protein kinase family protein [Neobacillus jeddahensis]|uniref:hypothetical protein n=1 Tax=Neobacillus jeddahensis TaxID=1461580 RepID=UPI0005907E92|nr:hypothetical protein [Neobacillus jeddahensis]
MFNKIFEYIKRKRQIKRSFHRHTQYMCAGIYEYDDSIKYIWRNDPYTKQRADQIFQNNYHQLSIKTLVFILRKTLFRNKFIVPYMGLYKNGFCGTVYRPVRSTQGYSDSKIFDLFSNQVLSVFYEEKHFLTVLEQYENFNNYFPMPAILCVDYEKKMIIEELVQFKQNHSWQEDDYLYLMFDIFNRYIDYFEQCIEKRISSFITAEDLLITTGSANETQDIFNKISPQIIGAKFPYLPLHGDLWTANTLLAKGEESNIYYIDWEYSMEYIFFYDFFHLMWLEVYVNNNYLYIDKYVKGDFDLYFKRIFSQFNLKFQDEFRLDYFYIYFLNFFKERLAHLDRIDQMDYLSKYKILLGKVQCVPQVIANKQYINMDM